MCVLSFQLLLSCNLLLLLGLHQFDAVAANNISSHLQLINKPAVSSIQSPDGDIMDCVLLYQQHAMDHPQLKNHTIQMKPSVYPNGYNSTHKVAWTQMWHEGGKCPTGTIPIRRTTEADIFRAKSIKDYGKKHQEPTYPTTTNLQSTDTNHQHAIVYVQGDTYYGSKATLNVWNPSVEQQNEFSLAQLWLLSGSFGSDLNSIEAGWQVSPNLYGDTKTRLFTYWTSDAYKSTGCYNLLCSGFVQVSNEIAVGGAISPISTYGQQQYNIDILIWKDPSSGNWWVQLGGSQLLGYWPSSLFTHLKDGATMLEWGGEIVNSKASGRHTTTKMGSGHFPLEGFGKAAYFSNVQIVDSSNNLDPASDLNFFSENPSCYDSQTGYNSNWKNFFYFGGPGYDPAKCP